MKRHAEQCRYAKRIANLFRSKRMRPGNLSENTQPGVSPADLEGQQPGKSPGNPRTQHTGKAGQKRSRKGRSHTSNADTTSGDCSETEHSEETCRSLQKRSRIENCLMNLPQTVPENARPEVSLAELEASQSERRSETPEILQKRTTGSAEHDITQRSLGNARSSTANANDTVTANSPGKDRLRALRKGKQQGRVSRKRQLPQQDTKKLRRGKYKKMREEDSDGTEQDAGLLGRTTTPQDRPQDAHLLRPRPQKRQRKDRQEGTTKKQKRAAWGCNPEARDTDRAEKKMTGDAPAGGAPGRKPGEIPEVVPTSTVEGAPPRRSRRGEGPRPPSPACGESPTERGADTL